MSVARYLDRITPQRPAPAEAELRVLVPILRTQTAGPLLAIGDALARQSRGQGNVLGLVEVPAHALETVAHEVVVRRRDLLRWIAATDDSPQPDATPGLGILVRVVHEVALGIREAVYETSANLVVVEWPGLTSRRPRLMATVIANLSAAPPADMLLVRPATVDSGFQIRARRVLAPVRGGPNARLAVRVAAALAQAWRAHLTVLHLSDPGTHPDRKAQETQALHEILAGVPGPHPELMERDAEDKGRAILEEAAGADLVVLGAYADRVSNPVLVRSRLAATLRRLTGTIILVRTVESLRSAERAQAAAQNGRRKGSTPAPLSR